MPERIEKLRATLAELEAELAQLDSLDEESRELLEVAAGDIQEALDKQDGGAFEPQTLSEHLQAAAENFEESHPALFRIVGNLVNALAQLGI